MGETKEIFFYIGTYGTEKENGIHLAALNRDSGEMRLVSSTTGIENASFLDWNKGTGMLYAVSEVEKSEIFAFRADPVTKELTLTGRASTSSSGACHLSHTSDGLHLLAASYGDAKVSVIALDTEGSLGELTSVIQHQGSSLRQDRQSEAHSHSVFEDPAQKYMMVCDLGLDEIILYRLEDGKLVTHREVSLPPGSGPRMLAFHSSGRWVYSINELNNTVTAFAYDATFGDLKILQHISTLPEDYGLENTAAQLHISPCGRFLYASNRGHDSIALFKIDNETGQLRANGWVPSGGKTPRHFSIFPGAKLVAANQDSSLIASFTISPESGELEPTGHTLEVTRPVCVCPVE